MLGAWLAACRGGGPEGGPVDPNPGNLRLRVAGGGFNVQERITSDLWVHGKLAYTGTWGGAKGSRTGNVVKLWRLGGTGAPTLADSIVIPGINTVSDLEVSQDGRVLLVAAEGGEHPGLYLYALAEAEAPRVLDTAMVATGVHTATFAGMADRHYVFAARNPAEPALLIYDVTDPSTMALAATVPVPANYGIHDTYVRDGVAFVFAWNTGVIIYDVGSGMRGGTPARPVEVSRLIPKANGVSGGPAAHNGWWFHNPVTGERRYLFVGQEGPQVMGSHASGDIHVLDVSDLAAPREVAFFHIEGAGTHNFWMDEERQILYAAYYNAGVVAIDVSGELRGDLSSRLISAIQPGGLGQTFTWGVQAVDRSIYASDMISGLWQLRLE